MNESRLLITMDGPGGTGKSTVSRALAERIGLPHLDTGAFYRAATLAALDAGADPSDEEAVLGVLDKAGLDQREGAMYFGGVDVSAEIRSDLVTRHVSAVSAHPRVRAMLVDLQRRWVDRQGGAAVVEGRDIGSVVFPEASLKIYLYASPLVRAERRAMETGEEVDEVLEDLNRRDALDSTRAASPLTVPEGAVVVDTSELGFEEVVDRLMALVEAAS